MASITERNGKFRARATRAGQTAAKTFVRKADAKAWALKTEADMEAGRWIAPATVKALAAVRAPTMAEALSEYRRTHAVSLKGAERYVYDFDFFAAQPCASKTVDAVNAADVAMMRDIWAKTNAPGTVVRKLALLSGFFSWCIKDRGWIERNPVHSVRKPRVGDARSRVLDDDEVGALLTSARSVQGNVWLHPTLVVLMNSAMRRGELFSLNVADVDFTSCTAHLADTKNGSARDVPLSPASVAAMRELVTLAMERAEADLKRSFARSALDGRAEEVWPVAPDLRKVKVLPLSRVMGITDAFRYALGKARADYAQRCEAAGVNPSADFLDDVHLHDLRHHAVTLHASSGALTLPELAAISGHKSTRMLMRYTHISASAIAQKLARIAKTDPKA
jgi:integrase